ncbi:hypothetical protein [Parabacteroides gordonii]|uniref:hypothetical protein n=1 Tax=Parabacteroides gordonii TaxID=574930 RepID=UPI0026ED241B|nr:hypothetical protein [Parabacteroides gordonii]
MKHVTSYIFLIIAFLLLGVNGAAAQEKDCPFTVTVDGNNTDISYDNKILSISSDDNVTITGNGKSTDWGIEIESLSNYLQVTIKDLNIEREGVPLKIKGSYNCYITIEGTNRFVSTGSSGTAGIEVKHILLLYGSGSLTAIGAKGDGDTSGGAGISGGQSLTILGGIIHAEGGAGAPGIGVSDPQKGMAIQIAGGTVTAIGGSGNNPAPGIDGGTSSDYPSIEGNAFVIAIDGMNAAGLAATTRIKDHKNGLFILGWQMPGGSIVQTSSVLKGNVTLESNAEIPAWATVTIADGQTFTIADGITLTNNGTLENNGTFTNKGTFTNNGTLSGNGTVESNTSLNIGGEDGFDVTKTGGNVTFSYDGTKELLTISGSGEVLIKGRNKDKAVGCGIVIAEGAKTALTIEDLNIVADEALVYRGSGGIPIECFLTLQGTNRLTSTRGVGMNFNDNYITLLGSGSLTVTGANGCAGIKAGSLWFYNKDNAFVVAIGGEGTTSGIDQSGRLYLNSGLLIQGSQQSGANISQTSSGLSDKFTLGVDAEIPAWATVTIADNQIFTIDAGVTLTNSGTINNEGTIYNRGTLTGNPVGGKLYHEIFFDVNYPGLSSINQGYILQGETLPTDIFTFSGYTFQGWYDAPDGGTKVETATKSQTLFARWKAVPVPEPEPEPEPEPTIYYTVTLPFVEGAVTDPVAGDYDVESWSTFRFYLTIDTAYSQSQPVVTTSRGETLQPRTSDGAYLLKYVRTDVEVYIDGILLNPPPVANEPIRTAAPEPEIWSENACLCIRLPEGLPTSSVRIFTAEGRLLDSFRSVPGLNRRQLPTGIYIVRVGETVRKIIVK